MAKHILPSDYEQIFAFADKGWPLRLIHSQLPHLNIRQVSRALTRLRKQGRIPLRNGTFQTPPPSHLPKGNLYKLVCELSSEQRAWLFAECAKTGVGSVAEYLTELVRDAYEETVASPTPTPK